MKIVLLSLRFLLFFRVSPFYSSLCILGAAVMSWHRQVTRVGPICRKLKIVQSLPCSTRWSSSLKWRLPFPFYRFFFCRPLRSLTVGPWRSFCGRVVTREKNENNENFSIRCRIFFFLTPLFFYFLSCVSFSLL